MKSSSSDIVVLPRLQPLLGLILLNQNESKSQVLKGSRSRRRKSRKFGRVMVVTARGSGLIDKARLSAAWHSRGHRFLTYQNDYI